MIVKGGAFLAFALAAALAVPMLHRNEAAAAMSHAPKRDWSKTVAITPEGGFRIGNPNAAVKLVEYGSLACPHCRHFEETGFKPLVDQYVRSGLVSYEFRNLLINGPDVSVSLLARCSGPGKFFAMSQLIYATQPDWEGRIEKMSDADKAQLAGMTDQQAIIRYAELGGMAEMAARFGVTPAQAQHCLKDPAGLKRLLDITKAATDSGIKHTPTFVINGKVSDSATWETLEPELKKALGDRG